MSKVYALTETSDLKPEHEGEVPQIFIGLDDYTTEGYMWHMSGISTTAIETAWAHFGNGPTFQRWLRIVTGSKVRVDVSRGFSQGDEGYVIAIASKEWLDHVGLDESFEMDKSTSAELGAWIWGDVYKVVGSEGGAPEDDWFFCYGMSAAMEYGEILFPQYRTEVYYDDED